MTWWMVVLLALPFSSFPPRSASAQEPLPRTEQELLKHTEEARMQRLDEVAAAHQLTPAGARKRADTQLFLGAFIIIASLLAPLAAEIRDEEFDALGSILMASIGMAVLIEGAHDEHQAEFLATQVDIQEQIDLIEQKGQTVESDSLPPPEDDERR